MEKTYDWIGLSEGSVLIEKSAHYQFKQLKDNAAVHVPILLL